MTPQHQGQPCVLAVGSLVSLAVVWGNQSRLRCVSCQRFMAASANHRCPCGAVYAPVPDSDHYLVEALS